LKAGECRRKDTPNLGNPIGGEVVEIARLIRRFNEAKDALRKLLAVA
jgi:hypothetical protein